MPFRDTRLAWIVWAVFALGIAACTLTKKDKIVLADAEGTRVVGHIVRRDRETVTIRVRDANEQIERTFTSADIVVVAPLGHNSVTTSYRFASEHWRKCTEIYTSGAQGFLYMPQAAMLFMPFELMPAWLGEVLWRWAGLAAYAWGVWTLCKRFFAEIRPTAFTLATLLAIPAALGSAQNGQTNLAMGGLFALAAVHAGERKWRLTTLWLVLALACKPVALPVVLLLAAVRPRLIPTLAAGMLVFLAAPFVHPDPAYVWSQYHESIGKMIAAADPGVSYTELRGMLRDFGWVLSDQALLPVRAAAAIAFLGVCMWMARRLREPLVVSFYAVTLGVIYILIFSPRTEGVTYAMIGPIAALLATGAIIARQWITASLLVAYCLILQFSMPITDLLTGEERKYWLRPLCTMMLAGWLFARLSIDKGRGARPGSSPVDRENEIPSPTRMF